LKSRLYSDLPYRRKLEVARLRHDSGTSSVWEGFGHDTTLALAVETVHRPNPPPLRESRIRAVEQVGQPAIALGKPELELDGTNIAKRNIGKRKMRNRTMRGSKSVFSRATASRSPNGCMTARMSTSWWGKWRLEPGSEQLIAGPQIGPLPVRHPFRHLLALCYIDLVPYYRVICAT